MKRIFLFLFALGSFLRAEGASTIDAANRFAYGANMGWMDWRTDSTNGVVIGEYVCSGYIYSANVGWINLGNGGPANGIRYQNDSSLDFGVNHDGQGNLSGYAYGANIGWINFETNGAPKLDLLTGVLSGYVYSANCGWISLSNSSAYVQTDSLSPGALDTNGLPIAWELTYFGTTGIDPQDDPDGDGQSNQQEYIADTNPTDAGSNLRIAEYYFDLTIPAGALEWTSVPTRLYYIETSTNLASGVWNDSSLGLISPDNGIGTIRQFSLPNSSAEFFRIHAVLPLSPP